MRYFLLIALLALSAPAFAEEELEDGTYDAQVTTQSGTYTVPVEVEDGEVSTVNWPNGGNMNVYGGDLSDGEASGTNSRGDWVQIEVEE